MVSPRKSNYFNYFPIFMLFTILLFPKVVSAAPEDAHFRMGTSTFTSTSSLTPTPR